jgi:hypothetical protein
MLSIDEMNDRNSMLRDIRAQVSLMKQNLSEILMNLSVVHPVEVDDLRVEESVPKEPVRKGSVEAERPDAMALPF